MRLSFWPLEWLTCNFSLLCYNWIKHYGHENEKTWSAPNLGVPARSINSPCHYQMCTENSTENMHTDDRAQRVEPRSKNWAESLYHFSAFSVNCTHLAQAIFCRLWDPLWIMNLITADGVKQIFLVFTSERRLLRKRKHDIKYAYAWNFTRSGISRKGNFLEQNMTKHKWKNNSNGYNTDCIPIQF